MPRWFLRALVLLGVLGLIPFALIARARVTTSTEPRIHIIRDMDNQAELAKTLSRYGEFLVERGNPDGGKILLEEARQIFQKLGMKKRDEVSRKLEDLAESE